MTEQMNKTFPEQILSLWPPSQGIAPNNCLGGFGSLDFSNISVNSSIARGDANRVAVVPSTLHPLEKVRNGTYSNVQRPQESRKRSLTLEEIVADHDLNESSPTLENSLNPGLRSCTDESGSDLDGLFDDEDDGNQSASSTPSREKEVVSPTASMDPTQSRFKPFHEEKWNARLKELIAYRKEHGDCLVPHTYNPNPQLARWVKRQRRQYKLMLEGRASTMTPERLKILNDIDFVWDSHEAAWHEKLNELNTYRKVHGNCLVPSNYKKNPQLATWVKCQRRQYKLYWEGRPSAMTPDRIVQLEKLGFEWEIRSSGQSSIDRSDYLLLSEAISKMK
eukprot:CAMPEP_0116844208 /NCGR_PEP_ID=MMETSP0418-20121206/12535_1 /TAXON_ID=1158023 /ORGANISM="Astrosyne radiata, Strain 13vi08-1A" /LENGTH=334 /DNA_ID=CAMNT_0004475085 /DNA_START=36 /DNA_END=1040 /DNA_ORIENTATION=-